MLSIDSSCGKAFGYVPTPSVLKVTEKNKNRLKFLWLEFSTKKVIIRNILMLGRVSNSLSNDEGIEVLKMLHHN